jgi:hypothetical protein
MTIAQFKDSLRYISQRSLGKLHSDEDGVAMTEFVICLPVFIIIFIGMVDLYKLSNAGVAIQIQATARMWTNAIEVQKSGPLSLSPHMNATVAGGQALSKVGEREMSAVKRALYSAEYAGMLTTGHFGESYANTILVESVFRVNMGLPTPGGKVKATVGQVVDAQGIVTKKMVNDGIGGLWPGVGAGIRYGLVNGKAEQTVATRLGSSTLKAGFDVNVAPYAHKGALDHGTTMITARMQLMSRPLFQTLYGINSSQRFKTN